MSDRDYYEILGLTPAADGAMVNQAYWHLARKYQSLAATNPRARHMLDELNEAYGVVGASRLRHQYDAFRDDVLITSGMIKPVKANPKRKPDEREAPAADEGKRSWPTLPLSKLPREHMRTYTTSAVIVALALAAAWQGVNPAFVIAALAAGLALVLAPALRRQLPEIALPALSMPEISAPRVHMPKLGEVNVARLRELGVGVAKDEPVDASALHASTSAMISRWRNSIGLRPMAAWDDDDERPSTTLVDIVESERGIKRRGRQGGSVSNRELRTIDVM
jgi:hypothetical protein